MQAKGLVQFFGIALIVVCLYQLSFTFFTNNIEGKAERYAAEKVAASADAADLNEDDKQIELLRERRRYLDSVATEPVVNLGVASFTYNQVKERQLNLGLDLQGGMSVVLQVSLVDLVKSLANNSQDPNFLQALTDAKKLQKSSEADFVTLFGQAFKAIDPNARLAAIFATAENQDKINFQTPDEEVLAVIGEEAKAAVERTFQIIRARIDKFGVTQPSINLQESTGRIIVELPGVDDPERVRKLLQATANLEFWETYEFDQDIANRLQSANTALRDALGYEAPEPKKAEEPAPADKVATDDSTAVAANDSTKEESLLADEDDETSLLDGAESDSLSQDELRKQNPLFAVFQPANGRSSVIGYVAGPDTSDFRRYLSMPEVKSNFPADFKFVLEAKALPGDDGESSNVFPVYAMKSRYSDMKAPLEGDVITDARQDFDYNQKIVVSMSMNSEGAKIWKQLTRDNIGKSVAIVLDDRVYSAPVVQTEIGGGQSQITGNFTVQEAQDLANILKAGKLPAPARIVEEAVVGPSLGQKSIRDGISSLIAGTLLVLLFMVFYYSNGGLVANLALILNLFFVIGVLASLGATLTLPGMAGIVLTIGMAVDANVIIFERIREELAKGSALRKAIADGYSKSYSAIIDANLTTLITAIILYYFGLGPVLGFATVLIIGILSSLFTAVLITRLVIEWYMGRGGELHYTTKLTEGAFKNLNIDFVNRRKFTYILSAIVLVIGLASITFKNFELGVDFQGGRTYVVQFPEAVTTSDVRNALTAPLENAPLVRTYGSNNQVKLTTSYLIDSEDPESDNVVIAKLHEGLAPLAGSPSYDDFTENNLQSSQKVGPTIADDIKRGAVWATIFALLGIFLYILLRFRRWQFGLAAVLTICHDTIVLLGAFSLFAGILPFSLEIDQTFIAALLTVIGYSINDTVVVFDRIREYLQLNPKRNEKEVINEAINSTLSRTIITSLTTLLVVLILFIFGGEVIRGFSFALLLGIVVGTYSSIFVATPLVIDLSEQYTKRVKAQAASKANNKRKRKPKSQKAQQA